jgi:hypothetical protein
MANWTLKVHPKVAGRINPVEQPIKTTGGTPATDEPQEEIQQDQTKPVTSHTRTAGEFVAEAERKENQMAQKQADAAAGAPAEAAPDTNVDADAMGGVVTPSNEEASKADAQVTVGEKGGTGVEDVSADQEETNLTGSGEAGGFDDTKTTDDSGPTATFPDGSSQVERQADPVSGDVFPASAEGVHSSTEHMALDAEAFPKDDEGLGGGSAIKGVQPADPVGVADQRVNVLQPTTSPENNSGATTTWTGTDGSKVERQVDPVTRETLEGNEGVTKNTHIISAFKLADLEVELGLIDARQKYDRVAQLEAESPEALDASLEYAQRVKTAGLKRQVREARRLPSLGRGAKKEASKSETQELGDEALYL